MAIEVCGDLCATEFERSGCVVAFITIQPCKRYPEAKEKVSTEEKKRHVEERLNETLN